MPQSLTCVYLHIIFSTKERFPFLSDSGLRDQLHALLGGLAKSLDCQPVRVGGMADHVHLLVQMGRGITQADLIKELKRNSTLWIKENFPHLTKFSWQAGYGVFSVSTSHLEAVQNYIENQPTHHATISFQEEFRRFLQRHHVTFDERFLWE